MERKADGAYGSNAALLRLAAEGDESAVSRLVEKNSALVYKIAHSFGGRGCEFDDLVQIGSIGLLKAIRSFDESRGFAFSTYAVPLIVGEIRRFLRDDGTLKVSRKLKKNAAVILREREKFLARAGREPRLDELAALSSISAEEAAEALSSAMPVASLTAPLGDDEDFSIENTVAAEDDIERCTENLALAEALDTLDPIQKKIVCLRYFRELSQKDTAQQLGLTQVKISREEKKIFAHLRKELSG